MFLWRFGRVMKSRSIGLFLFFLLPTPLVHAENVLLVSVDTLRADRLSCYGYNQNRTPNIDRWASEGIRFKRAYSETPLTLAAHSTLFTGTLPFFHGVIDNVGFVLDEKRVTLAEILRDGGFRTFGVIGSYVLSSSFGVSQGFELYDEEMGREPQDADRSPLVARSAQEVTEAFLKHLAAYRAEPFFAFVHFYDPHTPRPKGYDWEVSQVDKSIGEIDAALREWKLLDQTHVILIGDHGEGLGDHSESEHGFFVYDSTLHVPLIIRPASSFPPESHEVEESVSLVDVMPTILRLVGMTPPPIVQGRSLLGGMMGRSLADRGTYAETNVPYLQFGWSPLRSFRRGGYKFIDAPRPEFYDVENDPGESTNLYSEQQGLAKQYRKLMGEFVERYSPKEGPGADAVLDAEARAKLASLGYVALAGPQNEKLLSDGVDPKDRVKEFEKYHELLARIGSRESSPALLDEIAGLRRRAPEMWGLTFLEAGVYELLGNLRKAIEKYEAVLNEAPDNVLARSNLASLMLQTGNLDRAEETLRQVLLQNPEDSRARNNLAGVFKARGELDRAATELAKLVEIKPNYSVAWHNLGQIHAELRQWTQAEVALRRAVALDENNPQFHFDLALVLTELNQLDEAAAHLEKADELNRRTP